MKRRIRAIVSGRVQGVSYRAWTRRTAVELGLFGWVRNRDDGSVELVAEGESECLVVLAEALRQGPPLANVERVAVNDEAPSGEFTSFTIER